METILLNALWRTGSTWLWEGFRRNSSYHCYYEPCHEYLLFHTPEQDRQLLEQRAPAAMHHPDLDRPYYFEYPCLPTGGVPYYRKRFAYQRYCLSADDEDFELQQYFLNLCRHARSLSRLPVFQPNRMLLRSRWFCARFRALHIFLIRNYADVWRSMRRFENQFFPSMVACIVAQNQNHQYFRPLAKRFPLPAFTDPAVTREHEFYREVFLRDIRRGFACFYYFYVLTTLYNIDCADIVIDIDSIDSDPGRLLRLQQQFAARGVNAVLRECIVESRDTIIEEDTLDLRQEMEELAMKALCEEPDFSRRRVRARTRYLGNDLGQWMRRLVQ